MTSNTNTDTTYAVKNRAWLATYTSGQSFRAPKSDGLHNMFASLPFNMYKSNIKTHIKTAQSSIHLVTPKRGCRIPFQSTSSCVVYSTNSALFKFSLCLLIILISITSSWVAWMARLPLSLAPPRESERPLQSSLQRKDARSDRVPGSKRDLNIHVT
jgi:hypothetical protein